MATKNLHLDSGDVKKEEEIEDITTCCICTDVYTDPRALPCIHTFCMKCLQNSGLKTNKRPGDEMPCPICRRLFKIPPEGFSGLPKHFFIERLIQVSKVTDTSKETKSVCRLCMEECNEQEGRVTPTATTYCVECKYKLCEECCSEHRKFKATKHHKLIPLSEHDSGQNVISDLAPIVCEVHEHKVLDVYCANCKTVVCAICFIEDHKDHDGSHVSKCADGFRTKIKSNIETINGCIAQAQTKQKELLMVKEQLQEMVRSLEYDIDSRKEQIKQLADKHASSLLQSLTSEKRGRSKEIQMASDDFDAYVSNLQSYNSYCQSLMIMGSASDICSAHFDLSTRATELQQQCQPVIEQDIQSLKISFRRSEIELIDEEGGNLIGEIKNESDFKVKERSKEILLAERSKEIDLMRQGNQQRKDEIGTCTAHIEKLTQELENSKSAINAIQVSKDKLKHELDEEKKINNSFKARSDNTEAKYKALIHKLKQELENNKTAICAAQTNSEKEKADNRALVQKLKQELENNKTTVCAIRANTEKENAANRALIQKMKQELENYFTEINALVILNDRLKEELFVQKTANDSFQTNYHKLLQELDMSKVALTTLEINAEKLRNRIVELQYKSGPVLIHTIRTKAATERQIWIRGLTILDKDLFVLIGLNSDIEVYDSMSFNFSRRWNLKELTNPMDMVSCSRSKSLFIFDIKGFSVNSSEILRVDPNGKLIKKWSTAGDYVCLSVTDESNVIVTGHNKSKLIEYSSDGQSIREIDLSSSSGIRNPWHAVKLDNSNFVVSHGSCEDDLHRVCLVNADGKLKKSFGGPCGSSTGQMNRPGYLSVDRNGFVLVADLENSRVLLIDSDLKFMKEILSKDDTHRLREPLRILLDDSSGRLFVADNQSNNQRILIFEFK